MFQKVQKVARSLIVASVTLFIIVAAVLVWYVYGIHLDSRHIDTTYAFWMEHSAAQTAYPFDELKTQLAVYPIDTLYFHIGPLSESGQLATDLSIPTETLATLPTTNYAWIGQVRSEINLDDPTVRAAIVKSSQWALDQAFDGIHLDIEPVHEDDTAFLDLLKELRAALPGSAKISVAMDQWQPKLLTGWLAKAVGVPIESYWSTQQVEAVAPYVDELVVMTYDTGFHDPDLYEWWVEQQTVALSQIVPDSVKVRIGIPAYDQGSALDPTAENLATGLAGFDRGVHNVRSNLTHLAGLAIYPYWEMNAAEWEILTTHQNHETDSAQ